MAPVGALVSLYYDGAQPVDVGEHLQTLTGRTYRVETIRVQTRGRHVGRQHIMATVVDLAELPWDAVTHPLHWYSRGRR